ncbi:MAG: hypothetical protein ACOYCB_11515 [Fastidiosipilaceae bacterium]
MRWIIPIVDRTLLDVQDALIQIEAWRTQVANGQSPTVTELKGCLNVTDLNRIEANTRYISQFLQGYGFQMNVTTKVDWTDECLPNVDDVNRIIDNIEEIRNKYYEPAGMPSLPQTMVSFSDINAIERSLMLFREMLLGMVGAFRRSGTFRCGQGMKLPMNTGVTWITLEDLTWGDIEGESWEGLAIYNEGGNLEWLILQEKLKTGSPWVTTFLSSKI